MSIQRNGYPDMRNPQELKKHIFDTIQFYYPACLDLEDGGYRTGFLTDGTSTDSKTKHLVGTSRFIYVFSIGALLGGPDWCRQAAEHGLAFLRKHFRDRDNGGYYFTLKGHQAEDSAKRAYGHAFALVASSIALQAGISSAKDLLEDVHETLEKRFWDEEHGLYRDEWDREWSQLQPYRGQNANMHLCEAMLTAYEATSEPKYLERAYRLAKGVALTLASRSGGMIWEHYDASWQPDWEFNKNKTKDEFRPYGFIPGHQFEWSKLLLWLDRHISEPWMLAKAEELCELSWRLGWDREYSGIYYALSPEKQVIDSDKNYWVMAEAISAASLLAAKTGSERYWTYYDGLFRYSWDHLIDHRYGGWFQLLSRENKRYEEMKSPATKADYHPVAACYQTIRAFEGGEAGTDA